MEGVRVLALVFFGFICHVRFFWGAFVEIPRLGILVFCLLFLLFLMRLLCDEEVG